MKRDPMKSRSCLPGSLSLLVMLSIGFYALPVSAQLQNSLIKPVVGEFTANPNSTRIVVRAIGNATQQNLNFWILHNAGKPTVAYRFFAKFSAGSRISNGNWRYDGTLPLIPASLFPKGGTAQFLVFLDDGTYLDLRDSKNRLTGYTSLVLQAPGDADNAVPYLTANRANAKQSPLETAFYYRDVVNPALVAAGHRAVGRLADFKALFTESAAARFYNRADLGTGRDMHCGFLKPSRDVACYVSNVAASAQNPFFADFVGSDAAMARNGTPFATVAMVRIASTGNVYFMVFGSDGFLANAAALDNQAHVFAYGPIDGIDPLTGAIDPGEGFLPAPQNTSIPGNCLTCHVGESIIGGRDKGAFLPFDLDNFAFSPSYPRTPQEASFKTLNGLVLSTLSRSPAASVINAWFSDPNNNFTFNADNLPPGWKTTPTLGSSDPAYVPQLAEALYLNTVKPYCLACHETQPRLHFTTYRSFMGIAPVIGPYACNDGATMPNARATAVHWWRGIDDTDAATGIGTGQIMPAGRAHLVAALATNGLDTPVCKGNAGDESCVTVSEGGRAKVSCPVGEEIEKVVSAHYGNSTGVCGGFTEGTCNASEAATRAKICVGAQSCALNSNNFTYGDPCPGTGKKLALDVVCSRKFAFDRVCGAADEGNSLTLTCPSGTFTRVFFASYGKPHGTCSFPKIDSTCDARASLARVTSACVGKSTCTINVNNTTFGDPCPAQPKRLVVDLLCL